MPYDVIEPTDPTVDENNRLHRGLADFNRRRVTPALPNDGWREALRADVEMLTVEGEFLQGERADARSLLQNLPRHSAGFVAWFEQLRTNGPGQGDALFPWLAEHATHDEMRWFLSQEVAGEAGFEDLVALTQIRMPAGPKLELARNYWDEMGRGAEAGMHGPMLGRLAEAMSIKPVPETTVWEALALGNLMVGLAANRQYAYQSIGALGVIELTAPGRAIQVAKGLRRLGLDGKARIYFELHATLDVRHSQAWNAEVLEPLVAACPSFAIHIAEGAVMRLQAGARCFERYRRHFGSV